MLHSATPEEFFHRCSGDHQQVQNLAKLDVDGMQGRHWYGVLANLAEAYDLLLSFGLISEESKPNSAKASKVNPHQSSLNKLLQFGHAARATKSNGSFGAAGAPVVSMGITANIHPSQYIPMERCESGSHHAATKERFLIGSGRPVQPHQALSADYELPAGTSPWKWVPLVPRVAAMLQLSDAAASPDAAAAKWANLNGDEAVPECHDEDQIENTIYKPTYAGYPVLLPDGVCSRLRFKVQANQPTGFQAEWRVANRAFEIPGKFRIPAAVRRVVQYFEDPHQVLELEEDARDLHMSYQGGLNVESHLYRESGDIQGGARMGTAPWQCGVLAALLLVFDIFWGRYDEAALKRKGLKVTKEHLERSFSLLHVVGFSDMQCKGLATRAKNRLSIASASISLRLETHVRIAHT